MIQKNLVITAIVLIAAAMTMSVIAPAMAQIRPVEWDCAGPDRLEPRNGAYIQHVDTPLGSEDIDRNRSGMICQVEICIDAGEKCRPIVVAEFDDHPVFRNES